MTVVPMPSNLYLWAQDSSADIMSIDDTRYVNIYQSLGYIGGSFPIHDEFNAVWKNYGNWINYLNYQIGVKVDEITEEVQKQALNGYITGFNANEDKLSVEADSLYYSSGVAALKIHNNQWNEGDQILVNYSTLNRLYVINGSDWFYVDDTPALTGIMATNCSPLTARIDFYTFLLSDSEGNNVFIGGDTNINGDNIVSDYISQFTISGDVYIRVLGAFKTYDNGGNIGIIPVRQRGDVFYRESPATNAFVFASVNPGNDHYADITSTVSSVAPDGCSQYNMTALITPQNEWINILIGSINNKTIFSSYGTGTTLKTSHKFTMYEKTYYIYNDVGQSNPIDHDIYCDSWVFDRDK